MNKEVIIYLTGVVLGVTLGFTIKSKKAYDDGILIGKAIGHCECLIEQVEQRRKEFEETES